MKSYLWLQTWWLNVIILTCWNYVVSFHWLNFELSLIVPWQISLNAAGCEYRAWIKGIGQTWSMLLLFVSILTTLIGILVCHRLSVSDQFQCANSKKPMQIRAFWSAGIVQALDFKRIICNAEFASRRAADCHRRHPASCGTACADPSNMRSLSLTARSDPSVGTQDHRAPSAVGRAQGLVSQGSGPGFDPDLFHRAYYMPFSCQRRFEIKLRSSRPIKPPHRPR